MEGTKVNQKFDLENYSVNYGRKVITAIAFNLEAQKEEKISIPFGQFAKALDNNSDGYYIEIGVSYIGDDPHSGPYSETLPITLTTAQFLRELEDPTDLKEDDVAQYKKLIHQTISSIIENKAA